VTAVGITNGGTGYQVGDPIVITGAGTGAVAVAVSTVGRNGVITGVAVTAGGTGYTGRRRWQGAARQLSWTVSATVPVANYVAYCPAPRLLQRRHQDVVHADQV
jgi:hypothetical protein